MPTFILIVIIMTAGNPYTVTTNTIEFTSEKHCLEAGVKLRTETEDMAGVKYVKLACVEK